MRHSLIIKRKRRRAGEGGVPVESGSAEVRNPGLPRVDKFIYQRNWGSLLSHRPQWWYKKSAPCSAQHFYTTLPALSGLPPLRRWYKKPALRSRSPFIPPFPQGPSRRPPRWWYKKLPPRRWQPFYTTIPALSGNPQGATP